MKKKIITLILGLLLVVSIAGNVYQINLFNSKIYSLDNCNVEKNDLFSDLDEKENLLTANSEKIVSLEMEITDLQSEIETIKNNISSLETTPDDSASTTVNKNATEKEQLENKSDLTLEEELRLAQLKYEAGEIPEEDYKEYKESLEYFINKQNNQSQSEPEVIMPEGALELTPAGPDENFEMQHFESGVGVQIQ